MKNYLSAIALAATLFACGQEDQPVTTNTSVEAITVASISALPPCFWLDQGLVRYVASTKQLVACSNGKWIDVATGGAVGPQGPAGPQGPQGEQGPAGADGTDGTNGTNGADGSDGADGQDGTNGHDGAASLITQTTVTAGADCQHGGTRVDSGADTNANGTLDTSEITATTFVCNGGSSTPQAPAKPIPFVSVGPQIGDVFARIPGFEGDVQLRGYEGTFTAAYYLRASRVSAGPVWQLAIGIRVDANDPMTTQLNALTSAPSPMDLVITELKALRGGEPARTFEIKVFGARATSVSTALYDDSVVKIDYSIVLSFARLSFQAYDLRADGSLVATTRLDIDPSLPLHAAPQFAYSINRDAAEAKRDGVLVVSDLSLPQADGSFGVNGNNAQFGMVAWLLPTLVQAATGEVAHGCSVALFSGPRTPVGRFDLSNSTVDEVVLYPFSYLVSYGAGTVTYTPAP